MDGRFRAAKRHMFYRVRFGGWVCAYSGEGTTREVPVDSEAPQAGVVDGGTAGSGGYLPTARIMRKVCKRHVAIAREAALEECQVAGCRRRHA